jgi:hypothetical protein
LSKVGWEIGGTAVKTPNGWRLVEAKPDSILD